MRYKVGDTISLLPLVRGEEYGTVFVTDGLVNIAHQEHRITAVDTDDDCYQIIDYDTNLRHYVTDEMIDHKEELNDKLNIFLISGKAEHGKTTTGNVIKETLDGKTLMLNFGDFVKFTCSKYLGGSDEKNKANRDMWQKIGTDVCRKNNKEIWINIACELIKGLQTEYDNVVIADVRFINEIETFRENLKHISQTYTIRTTRVEKDGKPYNSTLTAQQKGHASETELDSYTFDFLISASSIEVIETRVKEILSLIQK